MTTKLEKLESALQAALGGRIVSLTEALGEMTIVVKPQDLLPAAAALRDDPALQFEQLTDLCGVDYSAYGGAPPGAGAASVPGVISPEGAPVPPSDVARDGARFAVVYHLLSITRNWRLRMRVFTEDDELPVVDSVIGIWPSANWYEREAFDLFGIVFTGHPDLRRILTDYGFVGHPFRKDFPLSGNVEMRYDPDQQRVIYQPVTIEPREVTPRIIREENYADVERAPKR